MDVNSAGRGARSITRAGKRALSLGLALLMVAGMLFGYFSFASRASAEGSMFTDGVIVREADPSTMDTYLQMLDLLTDTRYAGRLWTDKSVFAYGQTLAQIFDGKTRSFKNNVLGLNAKLDGVEGSINLNTDFLEVFSALGSSVQINENIPVDFMFLLDVSGSMGADPKKNDSSNSPGEKEDFDKDNLPINKTIKALNQAIETLLAANPESRFGVTIYGSTAAVLVPLGHYTKDGDTPFLTAGWIDKYGTQGLHFSITAAVKPRDGEAKTYYGDNAGKSNNEAHGTSGTGNLALDGTGGVTEGDGTSQESAFHVGHITNPQAGLAAAMDQFITGNSETTFKSNSGKTYSRIPALLHITDGQATDIAWVQQSAVTDSSDPWRQTVSQWNNVNWNYDLAYNSKKKDKDEYNASQLSGVGAAAPVIFQTLMTAAYYKAAVNAHYNGASVDSAGGGVDLQCYSVYASDNKPFATMADDQVKATISAILDPENYFKDLNSANSTDSSGLTAGENASEFIDTAYELYKKLAKGETIAETYGTKATSSTTTPDIEDFELPGSKNLSDAAYGDLGLTWDNVNSNINYVQKGHFQSTNFDDITSLMHQIVQSLQGSLFNPVVGQNDLGVSDSVTFMDPVGKYMEVKDVTHLALFGTLYSVKRAAVYSYEFNEAILATGKQEFKDGEYLREGWYKGTDPAEVEYGGAEQAGPNGKAEDAWKNGWVYRVNARTAASYVPSLESIRDSVNGEDVTLAKMRMTEYTFYRVYVESGFDEWKQNPAFGKAEGNITESTPGAYRLSDLRIWVEDTGEYNDSVVDAGGLESDTGFDRALWINIPANMIPLRTVTLSQDQGGNWTYESNIPGESDVVTPGSPQSASFPLRVFYEVGVEEDMLTSARRVNTAFLSAEYIANNRVRDAVWEEARGLGKEPNAGGRSESGIGTVELFSNWYNPENRYGDYITSNTEYSYGDPAATFSPSDENSYYLFENALPLYKAAYRYSSGTWSAVNTEEEGFSGSEFGGRILADGLTCVRTDDAIKAALGTLTPGDGDIVLFADDRLDDVTLKEDEEDPFPSTGWYFLAIEFFELNGDGTAESVSYCAAREGSEFGSAYQASGIKNGDMLCWYDASGKNTQVYPYLSADETGDRSRGRDYIGLQPSEYMGEDGKPEPLANDQKARNKAALAEGTWVVAARPGGLRVGNLAQQVQGKTTLWDGSGNITDGGEYTKYDEYKALRFPDRGDEFTVGYYAGNTTRTANNYYMPTISTSSSTGDGSGRSDIVVNTYLGNNGRLTVADTSVMVSKTLRTDAPGFPLNTERDFSFQVYIQGVTGSFDAVVVKQVTHTDGTSTWSRQLDYADITPDSKLFLLATDGTLAMVDENGNRVIKTGTDPDTNEAIYAYADPSKGDFKKDTQVYYIFVGSNTETGSLRVYANPDGPNATGHSSVPEIKETQKPGQDESAVYSVDRVWLCTPEQYEAYQGDGNGSYMNGDGSPIGSDTNKWKQLQPEGGFPLLTLTHETASTFSSSDVTVTGDYATNSPYWTEKVTFGIGAESLYDNSAVGSVSDASVIAANTAQITLKHGYGLLFAGLPNGTPYRFTEQIDADDASAGYSFDSVTHVTGADNQSTYTDAQGNQGAFTSGDGYYSITGSSAVYEHSAHYVNSVGLDALVVSKVLRTEKEDYPLTELDKSTEFTYTVTFTPPEGFGALGNLPFWKRDTSGLGFAPAPTDYNSIQSLINSENLLKPDAEGKYTFRLRGGESIVIYGLPIGTEYTLTEEEDSNYPIQGGSSYMSTGTVAKSTATNGNEVDNKVDFTNVKPTPESGTLAVEKRVIDEDDPGTAEFTFRVTLTVPPDAEFNYHFSVNLLSSRIFSAENPKDEDEPLIWSPDTDSGNRPEASDYTAEFTLHAGERIVIYGVPYGTKFTVTEIGRPGYNLQSVTDNTDPDKPQDHLAPEGDAISGIITREASAASFVFNNARAPFLPFTGRGGAGKFLAAGVLLVALAGAIRLVAVRRKRARNEE